MFVLGVCAGSLLPVHVNSPVCRQDINNITSSTKTCKNIYKRINDLDFNQVSLMIFNLILLLILLC